jgi:hypothetical protein
MCSPLGRTRTRKINFLASTSRPSIRKKSKSPSPRGIKESAGPGFLTSLPRPAFLRRKQLDARVIPEQEAHSRWCNIPEAMELETVVYLEDPKLPYDWKGVCHHGRWITGKGKAVEVEKFCKNGHPWKMFTRVNRQGNRICRRCQADAAKNARLRHKNAPITAG